jgi:integrase
VAIRSLCLSCGGGDGVILPALEAGVHIKAVADLLGHSSIAVTGDIYGHTADDTARAAVDGLIGTLGL